MQNFSEKDMYPPVARYFEDMGYTVRSEVLGIDATAVKGDEVLLLEFKKSFNITLLYQAIDRQKISKHTYMVIPKPRKRGGINRCSYIARKLELGLITVNMDAPGRDAPSREVCVVNEPAPTKTLNNKRSRLVITEAANRTFDGNKAGSRGEKLLTAYRERGIKIACMLYKHGEMTVSELKGHGCAKDTARILQRNIYGWFYTVKKGVYFLSDAGFNEIENGMFKQVVEHYLKN